MFSKLDTCFVYRTFYAMHGHEEYLVLYLLTATHFVFNPLACRGALLSKAAGDGNEVPLPTDRSGDERDVRRRGYWSSIREDSLVLICTLLRTLQGRLIVNLANGSGYATGSLTF